MPVDRKLKRSDLEYLYFDWIAWCKCLYKRSNGNIIYSSPAAKRISEKILSTLPRRYQNLKQGNDGVDLIYQRVAADHLDHKFNY